MKPYDGIVEVKVNDFYVRHPLTLEGIELAKRFLDVIANLIKKEAYLW